MPTREAPEGFQRNLGPGGLEVRTIGLADAETRAVGDAAAPVVEGYGAVYEEPTTIEGYFDEWDEEIAAGAGATTIAEGDIRSMFNHDTNRLLGRTSAGTLTLSEDDRGLYYSTLINPDDPHAMSVHAQVARGDVSGSSIWFRVLKEEWTYTTEDDSLERDKRRILEYALFETGPVVFPAFDTTTSVARSLKPLEGALRAAVPHDTRRARLASELVASREIDELRLLFADDAELRDAVCNCATTREAAPPGAPDDPATPPAAGHLARHLAFARGFAAHQGLPMKEAINA